MNEYKTDVMKRYNPLTKKQQVTLYNQMHNGCDLARQKLINSCLPLVIDMAKKFASTNKHIELEDLVQEGNVALIKAVDTWDINRATLTTIATYCIKTALIRVIQSCSYHIQHSRYLPKSAVKQVNQIKKCKSDDPKVISQETGISEITVKKLLSFSKEYRLRPKPKRYWNSEGSRDSGISPNFLEQVPETDSGAKEKQCFQDILELSEKILTKTEQQLLFDRYGINGRPHTLKVLSEKFNKSVQNVDKTLTSIQAKLRKAYKEG
tara:strand:- start:386 stop:1180 length:795 start_codon:yes stop_codon:yes gene_type:complete